MADLKKLIGNALNKANMSYGDKDKKKKSKNEAPKKMNVRNPSLIPTNSSPKSLSYPQPKQPDSSTNVKTAKDYKNERKALTQQFKTEKLKARQEKKLENIQTRTRPNAAKAIETAAGAATTALGLAEGVKKLFKKE